MNSMKTKRTLIFIIMAISFLIEFPLRTSIISAFAFSQPIAYIILSVAFYGALFASLLVLLIPEITFKAVTKAICIIVAFAVFEKIVSVFLLNIIAALVCQIIRPLLVLAIILLACRWILKCEISFNKVFSIAICGLIGLSAVFNTLDYFRFIHEMQNVGNDLFSYISLLASGNSMYNTLAALPTYALAYIGLIIPKRTVK